MQAKIKRSSPCAACMRACILVRSHKLRVASDLDLASHPDMCRCVIVMTMAWEAFSLVTSAVFCI